jgi:hypothetical protein
MLFPLRLIDRWTDRLAYLPRYWLKKRTLRYTQREGK